MPCSSSRNSMASLGRKPGSSSRRIGSGHCGGGCGRKQGCEACSDQDSLECPLNRALRGDEGPAKHVLLGARKPGQA